MAQIIIHPDEPAKFLKLFAKITGKDITDLQARTKDLTLSGPGITFHEKLSDTETLDLAILIQ